jgi:Arc/MetJ-type ribon-helix-helix transcriptional regulator
MRTSATSNFHLPLPKEVGDMLREEVERSGRPATAIAREALSDWLQARRRSRLREEITAYAEACAGTSADLDEDLEEAGVDLLIGEDAHEAR